MGCGLEPVVRAFLVVTRGGRWLFFTGTPGNGQRPLKSQRPGASPLCIFLRTSGSCLPGVGGNQEMSAPGSPETCGVSGQATAPMCSATARRNPEAHTWPLSRRGWGLWGGSSEATRPSPPENAR